MTAPAENVTFVGQQELDIDDLTPHPDNPNRGSVEDLSDSLTQFGQFRSIVATTDGVILAGHHLVEAARANGLKTVRVDVLDTDENTARKIMLADNRLADLGLGPDLDLLLDNLNQLDGDIIGTGFDDNYVRILEEAVGGPPTLDELDEEANEEPAHPSDFYRRMTLLLDPALCTRWESYRKAYDTDTAAFGALFGAKVAEKDEG